MRWLASPPAARHPRDFIPPCLPTLGHVVPDGPLWVHEIKHDGFRFIVRRQGDRVRAFSRRGYDWTERLPQIVDAMRALPATSVIDGEAVVCDARRVSDFEALRIALARGGPPAAILYAFELLEPDGPDLRPSPSENPRAALTALLRGRPPAFSSPSTWTTTTRRYSVRVSSIG
jgi:bifunctional non-homologous end joining protein LigD